MHTFLVVFVGVLMFKKVLQLHCIALLYNFATFILIVYIIVELHLKLKNRFNFYLVFFVKGAHFFFFFTLVFISVVSLVQDSGPG